MNKVFIRISCENVDLKSEKAQKLLIKVQKTLELPNLVELQKVNDEDAKIGYSFYRTDCKKISIHKRVLGQDK